MALLWSIMVGLAVLVGGGFIWYLTNYVYDAVNLQLAPSYPTFYTGTYYNLLTGLMNWIPLVILLLIALYVFTNNSRVGGEY